MFCLILTTQWFIHINLPNESDPIPTTATYKCILAAGFGKKAIVHFFDVDTLVFELDALAKAGVDDVSFRVSLFSYPNFRPSSVFEGEYAQMKAAGINVNRKFYFDLSDQCDWGTNLESYYVEYF